MCMEHRLKVLEGERGVENMSMRTFYHFIVAIDNHLRKVCSFRSLFTVAEKDMLCIWKEIRDFGRCTGSESGTNKILVK